MCLIFCQKKVLLLAYDFGVKFKLKTAVFNLKIHPSKTIHVPSFFRFVTHFLIFLNPVLSIVMYQRHKIEGMYYEKEKKGRK